ncbi:MAG: UbiH/UbiF family hydroxylase [Pseudomonadota bacterium]
MANFDVIIVGGGLVGAGLAAALANNGLKLALVEAGATPSAPGADWDQRVYAISPNEAAFLEQCGVWKRLDESRVERVEAMEVYGDTGARLDFSAYQSGVRELAFILESGRLHHALWQGLERQDDLVLFGSAWCASFTCGDDDAVLGLADGSTLRGKLIVGADGGNSWVRAQAGIAATTRAYGQMGVVANFECEKPHRGIARQWFRADGILAYLPLPERRMSMVWSAWDAKAQTLLALSPQALCDEVAQAGQHSLGELRLVTPPAAFPLKIQKVGRLIAPRCALIGDAAHGVHPLAGQGVNLGLRDARELAQALKNRGANPDCGDHALLRRYERARREDILAVQMVTDGLQRLFGSAVPGLGRLRNTGLDLANRLAPLKKLLVRHALG